MEYPKDLTKLTNYMKKTFGSFLTKILELYPENSTSQSNLAHRYKTILDHFPILMKSDEERLGEFIVLTAVEEGDRRLQFLAVVINFYHFSHLERSHAFSDDDSGDDSKSSFHEDDELDDHEDDNPDDENYRNSQDSCDSSDNSSSDNDNDNDNKSFTFHPKKIGAIKSKSKYEKYNDAWKLLILGQDKAVLFLYPIMSKTSKSIFETKILTDQVLSAFKNILKENVEFLMDGKLPIQKNIVANNELLVLEDKDVAHVEKRQKK